MTQYPSLHMIIDGAPVSGGGRRMHAVVNPATGETIGELPLANAADLDRALEVRIGRGHPGKAHPVERLSRTVRIARSAVLLLAESAVGILHLEELGDQRAPGGDRNARLGRRDEGIGHGDDLVARHQLGSEEGPVVAGLDLVVQDACHGGILAFPGLLIMLFLL